MSLSMSSVVLLVLMIQQTSQCHVQPSQLDISYQYALESIVVHNRPIHMYNATIFTTHLPSKLCNALSIWNDKNLIIIPGNGNKMLYKIDLSSPSKTLISNTIQSSIFWDSEATTFTTTSDGGFIYYMDNNNHIQIYDIHKDTISSTQIVSNFIKPCIALDELNSILYITGGGDQNAAATTEVQKCVISGVCRSISSMNTPRTAHVCQYYANKLYVFSGYSLTRSGGTIEVLDTTFDDNKWTTLPTEMMYRYRSRSVLNRETEQIVIMGGDNNANNGGFIKLVEIFNLKDNTMDTNYIGYLANITEFSTVSFDPITQMAYYIGGGWCNLGTPECYDTIQLLTFPTTINYTTTTNAPQRSSSSMGLYSILYVIVAVVILIIIIGFIFYFRRRSRKKQMRLVSGRVISVEMGSTSNIINTQSYGTNTNIYGKKQKKEESKSKSKSSRSKEASDLYTDHTTKGGTPKGGESNYGSFQPVALNTMDNNDGSDEDMYDPEQVVTTPKTPGSMMPFEGN